MKIMYNYDGMDAKTAREEFDNRIKSIKRMTEDIEDMKNRIKAMTDGIEKTTADLKKAIKTYGLVKDSLSNSLYYICAIPSRVPPGTTMIPNGIDDENYKKMFLDMIPNRKK